MSIYGGGENDNENNYNDDIVHNNDDRASVNRQVYKSVVQLAMLYSPDRWSAKKCLRIAEYHRKADAEVDVRCN